MSTLFRIAAIILAVVSVFIIVAGASEGVLLVFISGFLGIMLGLALWVIADLMEKVDFLYDKLGIYTNQPSENSDDLPQKTCARCDESYDFDYPKCPHCGHED